MLWQDNASEKPIAVTANPQKNVAVTQAEDSGNESATVTGEARNIVESNDTLDISLFGFQGSMKLVEVSGTLYVLNYLQH